MKLLFKASPIKLGSVPFLRNSEIKHLLICGATGTGKTNALRSLMHQIRQRGDRAIIVDTTGDFVSKFFREEKDILFNPYDKRSQGWHPWCECSYDYDYEQLVWSLIPRMDQNHDSFFQEAGRAVISAALKKQKKSDKLDIKGLVDGLLTKSITELYTE